MPFLHGIEVAEATEGARPIRVASASVIGIVGTAPQGPLDTPTLVTSLKEAVAAFGARDADHTLPNALDAIFQQVGAQVVVVRAARVAPDDVYDHGATTTNVIGGVDGGTGAYEGISALLAAQSTVGVTPRILCAPGFSNQQTVAEALDAVADRVRGFGIIEGPSTTDGAATTYAGLFDSARLYLVDPDVLALDHTGASATFPNSGYVAGVIARSDSERGFWWSPSNRTLRGITGLARPIDFTMGDPSSRANVLNENNIATIIRESGYRLWGNRTLSSDAKWAFLCVRRTADVINDSLLAAHLWAVDRGITKTYVDDVTESVNAFLRSLKAQGAILGGACWADPELNTPDQIAQGNVYFDFDFTPVYPAEHVTFTAHLVDDYIEEVFA